MINLSIKHALASAEPKNDLLIHGWVRTRRVPLPGGTG